MAQMQSAGGRRRENVAKTTLSQAMSAILLRDAECCLWRWIKLGINWGWAGVGLGIE